MKGYQICTRCVMDTTAEEIKFDSRGVCSFCHYFDENVKPILELSLSGESKKMLEAIVTNIKRSGHGRRYDSVLGLSGGVDSSYLAYQASELGLRPLLVHVNTGWNSSESEINLKNISDILEFDLKIIDVDWEEMRDLQIAFYKSAVMNCEIPQDHAFLAVLYKEASKIGANYILSGGNLATESILPKSWGYNAGDARHLLEIHKRFGSHPLQDFPILNFWERYLYYPFMRKIREVRLLNYMNYNREEAKQILSEKFGWKDYGAKHYESVLTRFFQGYYLPTKFGIDKRKAHFSSLILAGQMTREQALEELKKPPYPSEELLQSDMAYIAERLGLSLSEWKEILSLPPRSHEDYPSNRVLFKIKDILVETLGIRKRRIGKM